MELIVKSFEQLTTRELYELLRVRAEVFVVEQNCVYQDLDETDFRSLHMYFEEDGRIAAYLRVFEAEPGIMQVGRVLTVKRGVGLGGELLHKALQETIARFDPAKIVLEAQCYAAGFHAREGFVICSEEFLEDGIPHVKMELVRR